MAEQPFEIRPPGRRKRCAFDFGSVGCMLPMLNPGDETTEGTAPAVRRSSRELVEPGLSFPFFSPSDPVLLRRWQSQGCVEGMFQSVGNVWCDLRSEFLTASQFVTVRVRFRDAWLPGLLRLLLLVCILDHPVGWTKR